MRKAILFLFVLMLIFCSLTSVGAFQNEPDGFRGLKWGNPPTEDMKVVGKNEDEDTKYYTRFADKKGIGDAKFYLLRYGFYKNRFYDVMGFLRNKDDYDILKTICEEKFGEPTEEGYCRLNWHGEKAAVALYYDIIEESGYFAIIGWQIFLEKYKADEQKELEKTEEDF